MCTRGSSKIRGRVRPPGCCGEEAENDGRERTSSCLYSRARQARFVVGGGGKGTIRVAEDGESPGVPYHTSLRTRGI